METANRKHLRNGWKGGRQILWRYWQAVGSTLRTAEYLKLGFVIVWACRTGHTPAIPLKQAWPSPIK